LRERIEDAIVQARLPRTRWRAVFERGPPNRLGRDFWSRKTLTKIRIRFDGAAGRGAAPGVTRMGSMPLNLPRAERGSDRERALPAKCLETYPWKRDRNAPRVQDEPWKTLPPARGRFRLVLVDRAYRVGLLSPIWSGWPSRAVRNGDPSSRRAGFDEAACLSVPPYAQVSFATRGAEGAFVVTLSARSVPKNVWRH